MAETDGIRLKQSDPSRILSPIRLRQTVQLAWPRILTGFARMSGTAVDFAVVGAISGPAGIAGVAFGMLYYSLANSLSLGFAGGTVSLVAQAIGANNRERVRSVVTHSGLGALLIAIIITALYWSTASHLLAVVGATGDTLVFGVRYLQVVAFGVPFAFLNSIATRTFAGLGDTHTPMIVRVGGAVLNASLTAIFVFIFELRIAGAAAGTVIATGLVALCFWGGFITGWLPEDTFDDPLVRTHHPIIDISLFVQLITISGPLMVRRIIKKGIQIPMLYFLSTFGPVVVAAFEISRRVRSILSAPSWGLSLATSSLVGQAVGAQRPTLAQSYTRDLLVVAGGVHVLFALTGIIFAPSLATLFISQPHHHFLTTTFIRVSGVTVVLLGLNGVAVGVLRVTNKTRWPLYATLTGQYLVSLPLVILAAQQYGLPLLYIAMVLQALVPATITCFKAHTTDWNSIGEITGSIANQ